MIHTAEPQTAAEWMARLRKADDPATRQAYELWLDEQPENRASAATLDQAWESVGELGDDPLVQEILAAPPKTASGGFFSPAFQLATALMLGFTMIAAFFVWRHLESAAVYQTATGEQQVVDLRDGSRLHLNVGTLLEVDLRSNERGAHLVRGQAFFDVAPDPDRPFVVTAGDKEITVLGTKFDVLLQDGETRVTVIEGRVAVTSLAEEEPSVPADPQHSSGTSAENAEAPIEAPQKRLELTAHDVIRWPKSAPPSPLDAKPTIETVEAWLDGKVIFSEAPLEDAVLELDRYTSETVRLASPELADLTVSGVFYVERLADVDSLIFALESSLPIQAERRDNEILLLAADKS